MSRIFEYLLDTSKRIRIKESLGENYYSLETRGMRGLNQVILPNFKDAEEDSTPETSIELRPIPSTLETLNITNEVSKGNAHLAPMEITGASPELDLIVSSVGNYTEASNFRTYSALSVSLKPKSLEPSNRSQYYLSFRAIAPKMDPVEIHLSNGDILSVRGDIELFFRDKARLNFTARIPFRSILRVSYAQILPAKESLLSRLRKSQYAISQV